MINVSIFQHRTPGLWERVWVGTAWGMPVPSNVLVFTLPQICMSVYYYDNSGLVEELHGYQGRTTWKCLPRHCGAPKIMGSYACFVIEVLGWYGLGYACTIQSLLFILPQTCMTVYYYDNSGLVEELPGYEGRTTWKGLPIDCGTSKLGWLCPGLWERFWVGTAWGMPVPSKVLLFILPQTYMSLY